MNIANKVEKFISNKKNRDLLFFIAGVVILYFYIKNKQKQSAIDENGYRSMPDGYLTKTAGSASTGSGSTNTNVNQFPNYSGQVTPKILTYGFPGHLNLEITGTPKNWMVTDKVLIFPESGYRFGYLINSTLGFRSDALTNFNWKSNNPLTIEKMMYRNDISDMYFWGTTDQAQQDESHGKVFSNNNSVAFQTWIFNRN